MTQLRHPSAKPHKPKRRLAHRDRAGEPRGEGITRDERGQVQPKDKKTAQRAGSGARS